MQDSSTVASSIANGKKLAGQSASTKLDISKRKLLIYAKQGNTTIMSSLTPYGEKKQDIWLNSNNQSKELMFQGISKNLPSTKFDSLSNSEVIDSLLFRSFKISGIEEGKTVYNAILLSKFYKGYDFEIFYVYTDEKKGFEIEEMLRNSHFTK